MSGYGNRCKENFAVWWILYVILLNSVEIRQNHLNCLSYRKEPLHSSFFDCENIASIETTILIFFFKENAFDFFFLPQWRC